MSYTKFSQGFYVSMFLRVSMNRYTRILSIVFYCNFCNKSYSRPPALPFCGVVRMWARGAIIPPAHVICASQFNRFCSAVIYKSSLFCPLLLPMRPLLPSCRQPSKVSTRLVCAWYLLANHWQSSTKHLTSNWQSSTKHLTSKCQAVDICLALAWQLLGNACQAFLSQASGVQLTDSIKQMTIGWRSWCTRAIQNFGIETYSLNYFENINWDKVISSMNTTILSYGVSRSRVSFTVKE